MFNLAGVNRPQDPKEFSEGNFGFASTLLDMLKKYENLKPNQASEIDNRMLEEFPALNESFPENMNVYLEDRVGFRTELMTAYQTLCYRGLHYIPRPAYRVGKDGYIMVTWDLITYQHLDVPESYIQNFSAYIKSLQQLCESRGIDFTFWFIPNKETIYPEKFPDQYFVNHFSEVTMIHSYNLANIEYYISVFDPDVVILEAVERALGGDSTNRYAEEYMTKRFFSQSSLETPEGITYTAIEMTGKDLDYTTAEVYCPDSGKTYISVTGTLSTEIDRPGAMELAVGGKEYYPAFDENGGFHFLVDADDWHQGSEPVFLKFSPK